MVQRFVLKLKATFWSKNYIPETILKNFSVKDIIKFPMSIWQGTNVTKYKIRY